jgi:hypothetical protein
VEVLRNTHRKTQTVLLPATLRTPERPESVIRVVRDIEPAAIGEYREQGKANLYGYEATVATRSGKVWVVLELQESASYDPKGTVAVWLRPNGETEA